jgi:hypothetical protein
VIKGRVWNIDGMGLRVENRNTRRNAYLIATFYTTNLAQTGQRLIPALSKKKRQANKYLSHGRVFQPFSSVVSGCLAEMSVSRKTFPNFCNTHVEYYGERVINRHVYRIRIEQQFQTYFINQILIGVNQYVTIAGRKS